MRLLERDAELGVLNASWSEAQGGRGRFFFLGGEGGAGKTSVALEFAHRVSSRARLLVGACDAGATPRALGPLIDIAGPLGVQAELDDPDLRRGSLFPAVRAALSWSPTVLLLEDVHWADEATLDLIRYLARRMEGLPVLVIATYRDDEVGGTHPLSAVMGDLATASAVGRLRLPLLTIDAVAQVARESGREVDVAALHRSTDGNPFFVTEVLAAGGEHLPATVRDAVAARAGRLTIPARRVLDVAAVIGSPAEVGTVLSVSGEPSRAIDECVAGGVLLDRGTAVTFRHELARQAILDALPPAARFDVHRRVLTQLQAAGSTDHRRLAQHAVGCGDAAAVATHAPRAAELAARLGSHREAVQHLRTALRHDGALVDVDRANLLERLSYECYLTSQLPEALDARQQAVTLRRGMADARRLGVSQRWLSRLSWSMGRTADAQGYAAAAVSTLEPLGPGADLAMAYSNIAFLRMVGGTAQDALDWGGRAVEAARAAGDSESEAHALNNMGTALLRRGDLAAGRGLLDRSLRIALANDLPEQAARAWVNLGVLQFAKRMLAEAEQTLRTGMAYSAERDLDSSLLSMRGWLSGVVLEQGQTETAVALANDVLRHPHLSPVSRISVLLTTTLAALRSGEPAERQLTELRALVSGAAEPLRALPLALLQAEAAWTAGRTADIVALTDNVWAACNLSWEPWIMAELAWWRRLGGARDDVIAVELPAPFALMRDGRAREAAAAWDAVGRPFWAALALAHGGRAETAEAVAALLRLGATASAKAVRRDLALSGRPVPRGPRATARSNVAGLTARQLDILEFLVDGLSDAEIAAALTLSERTVGHHVSAVLRKLEVPTRSRAAAAAGRILGVPAAS